MATINSSSSTERTSDSTNPLRFLTDLESSLEEAIRGIVQTGLSAHKDLHEAAKCFDLKRIHLILEPGAISETARNTTIYFLSLMDRSADIETLLERLFKKANISQDVTALALMSACKRADCALVSQILGKVEISHEVLCGLFLFVSREGNLNIFRLFLRLYDIPVKILDAALIEAAKEDRAQIVQELLTRKKVSESAQNEAFLLAVRKGNLLICREWLERGVLSTLQLSEALSIAIPLHKTHVSIIEALITSVDMTPSDVRTVLLFAAENDYFQIVHALRVRGMITDASLRSEALEVAARGDHVFSLTVLAELVASGLILSKKSDLERSLELRLLYLTKEGSPKRIPDLLGHEVLTEHIQLDLLGGAIDWSSLHRIAKQIADNPTLAIIHQRPEPALEETTRGIAQTCLSADKDLHEAAKCFNLKRIDSILASGAISETARNTAVYFLSLMDRSADIETLLETLFEKGPIALDARNQAVISACKRGDCALFSQILRKGEISKEIVFTLFFFVAREGNLNILKEFLKFYDIPEKTRDAVLIEAVKYNRAQIVRELLTRKLVSGFAQNQAFLLAVKEGNFLICREFLERGELSSLNCSRALQIAIPLHKTHLLIIEALITSGDIAPSDLKTVLLFAAKNHYFQIVHALRARGMITDASLRSEALELVAMEDGPLKDSIRVLEELVASGPILPNKRDRAFVLACCAGHLSLIETLIQNSSIADSALRQGGLVVIDQGRCDIFRKLIESGIFSTDSLKAMLFAVISRENISMLEILLNASLSDDLQALGLKVAAQESKPSIFLMLAQKSQLSDQELELTLFYLLRKGFVERVADLLAHQSLTEEIRNHFLLEAINRNSIEGVEKLIKGNVISERTQEMMFMKAANKPSIFLMLAQKFHLSVRLLGSILMQLIKDNRSESVSDLLSHQTLEEADRCLLLVQAIKEDCVEAIKCLIKGHPLSESNQQKVFATCVEEQRFAILEELLKHPPIFPSAREVAVGTATRRVQAMFESAAFS